jgi:hypothetical protein
MNRIPVWINGEIQLAELVRAFNSLGYHARSDAFGRLCIDPVPNFLKHDEAEILPLKRRKRA